MDDRRLERVHALVERGVHDGVYPAAAYAVVRGGRVWAKGAFGRIQPDGPNEAETDEHTIFDMASLSKPITATLLLQAVEEGRLHLRMALQDVLPEAVDAPVGPVSLQRLATHTSGLPAWKPLYKSEQPIQEIFRTELEAEPGTRYAYSDLGYILLGQLVARVFDRPLDALAQERIFAPLGMTRTAYRPDASLQPEIAATANCPWRDGRTLIGEVHDANAHSLGGIAGHAGIFSTLADMIRFASLFAPQDDRKPVGAVLSRLSIRLASENQIDSAIGGHSIGWFTPPNGMLPRADLLSDRTFGHTGFTGTMLWIDPHYSLAGILLTNRVYQPAEGKALLRLRWLFSNAAASAVL